MVEEKGTKSAIFRDIRRYTCEYCGICRSKKSLISVHILSHHQSEVKDKEPKETAKVAKMNVCKECGLSFKKPAYLKQHMQSHSLEVREALDPKKNSKMREAKSFLEWISIRSGDLLRSSFKQASITLSWAFERPFTCSVDDCHSSYRRKDHLTRHLLQHQGKLFECPVDTCKRRFSIQGNMKRHVREFHTEPSSSDSESPKQYVCSTSGCGKIFKFASKLRKHEDSHVTLETLGAFCSEPGCMEYFANEQCLKEHVRSRHQHVVCEKCGTQHLKKNIKRHLRMHEAGVSSVRVKCSYDGCPCTFSTMSNLKQHINAIHLEVKPFTCKFPGCGMKFSFRHVRDNHERSGCHVYTHGDFVESDEQFRSRPRGGRKRKFPGIETLMRKRKRIVLPLPSDPILNQESDYLQRLFSFSDSEDDERSI